MSQNPVNAPLKPEMVETGVWPSRRRLTLAEAERGALPARFTADEWRDMAETSRKLAVLAMNRMAGYL